MRKPGKRPLSPPNVSKLWSSSLDLRERLRAFSRLRPLRRPADGEAQSGIPGIRALPNNLLSAGSVSDYTPAGHDPQRPRPTSPLSSRPIHPPWRRPRPKRTRPQSLSQYIRRRIRPRSCGGRRLTSAAQSTPHGYALSAPLWRIPSATRTTTRCSTDPLQGRVRAATIRRPAAGAHVRRLRRRGEYPEQPAGPERGDAFHVGSGRPR